MGSTSGGRRARAAAAEIAVSSCFCFPRSVAASAIQALTSGATPAPGFVAAADEAAFAHRGAAFVDVGFFFFGGAGFASGAPVSKS
jgi:hypothetical protein